MIASAMFRIARPNAAHGYIDAVIRNHSSEANVLTAAAQVEAEAGFHSQAGVLLRQALVLNPSFAPAREALIELNKRPPATP
jgi:hypothetical protein